MRKIIPLLFVLWMWMSCNKANTPEGKWIYSHEYHFQDSIRRLTGSPEYRLFIIEFQGSRMLEHILLHPEFGHHKNPRQYTITPKGQDIVIDENVTIRGVNPDTDSLVMTIKHPNLTRELVFDKLHADQSPDNWSLTEKFYRLKAKKSNIKQLEFINDSIWIANTGDGFSVNSWSIERYKGLTFLVLDFAIGSSPLLLDSVTSKGLNFTLFDSQNQELEFQELPIPTNGREKVIGHWELIERKFADSSFTHGIPRSDILQLNFMKDSLDYEEEFFTRKFKNNEHWELSISNEFILRSTHPYTDKTVWHIDSISSNTLTIERYDDIKQKLIYTYKRTESVD